MGFLDEGGAGDLSRLDRLFGDLHRETHGFTQDREGFGADKRIRAEALTEARRLEKSDPGLAARKCRETSNALMGARGHDDQVKRQRLQVQTKVWRTIKSEAADAARSTHMDRPYIRAASKLASGITARMQGEYGIATLNPSDRTTVALAVAGRDRFTADVEPHLKSLAIAERAVEAETLAMIPATVGPHGKTYSRDQIRRQTELRQSLKPHRERAQAALEGAVASDAGGDDWTPLAGPLANDGHGDGLVPQSDGRVLVADGTPQALGA